MLRLKFLLFCMHVNMLMSEPIQPFYYHSVLFSPLSFEAHFIDYKSLESLDFSVLLDIAAIFYTYVFFGSSCSSVWSHGTD